MNCLRLVGRGSLVLLFANRRPDGSGELAVPQISTHRLRRTRRRPCRSRRPTTPDDIPAHIAVVDGTATIERDGRVETAEENILLLAGDRLRTERGRVEVLFADGSALDLDHVHAGRSAVGFARAAARRAAFG